MLKQDDQIKKTNSILFTINRSQIITDFTGQKEVILRIVSCLQPLFYRMDYRLRKRDPKTRNPSVRPAVDEENTKRKEKN